MTCRILCIDDPKSPGTISGYLRTCTDIETDIVFSGDEGLERIKVNRYAAVFLDNNPEGMDGIRVFRKIRSSGFTFPVIIILPDDREDLAVESLHAGVDFYLHKRIGRELFGAFLDSRIIPEIRRRSPDFDTCSCPDSSQEQNQPVPGQDFRIDTIFYVAPFGVLLFRLEPDDRLVLYQTNRSADRIFKVDCSEFIGKTLEEIFPPLSLTNTPASLRKVARTGQFFEDELIPVDHGGIYGVYDEVHAFPMGNNVVAVLFWDITERRKAERRIEYLASFPELNPNPILEVSSTGIVYANPACHDILAYENLPDQVDLFLPPDITDILSVPNSPDNPISRIVEVGSRVFYLSFSDAIEKDHVRIYGRDITDLRKAERERDVAFAQVSRNFAEFAILNDGIRSPLTIISLIADEHIPDRFEEIDQQIQRVDRLINKIDECWNESEKILRFLERHHRIRIR